MNKKPAALLAHAKGKKKKVSKKQLHKAAQLLGAQGGHQRAFNQKAAELTRIGVYGAKIRWGLIDKNSSPWQSFKL